ncbi:MAG TPA: hypothetical protein VFT06_16850 [Flavisolibacter sp.]|jgi:hypothetical protein|nr:hypothetical protein [Flavisolibacter sp.]
MNKLFTLFLITLFLHGVAAAQADNEIQVYASPTIQHKWTIFELHSNYTFTGTRGMADPALARWQNETLEITHGLGKNFELGFYTFTGFSPRGDFQYLGNQIRPRITAPQNWHWPVGASLSAEFGFFRPHKDSDFQWQGEVRPIVDKTWGNVYLSFNPNIEFVLTGPEKGAGLAPQVKSVYTLNKIYGVGFEYYGALGSFRRILPYRQQEHLLGPAVDLYLHPMWEVNAGFLFGLTDNSNQRIFKLLLGRRIGK